MDAELYIKIEQSLIVVNMALVLVVIWVVMQILKAKVRHLCQLELLVQRRKDQLWNRSTI